MLYGPSASTSFASQAIEHAKLPTIEETLPADGLVAKARLLHAGSCTTRGAVFWTDQDARHQKGRKTGERKFGLFTQSTSD